MAKGVCAIVGMGPGVALGVAERFGKEGYDIVMVARKRSSLEEFRDHLKAKAIAAHAFVADAGSQDELKRAFEEIHSTVGVIEVLHYNAAVLRQATPLQSQAKDLVSEFQVNVVGAAVCAQLVAPRMVERKHGTILLTGGGLALYPTAAFFSLGVGKAGIRQLAYDLQQELSPKGIRVGTVTICGEVKRGTPFSPERIAEEFYQLHGGKPDDPCEVQFTGE